MKLLVKDLRIGMIIETPDKEFCKITSLSTAETDQLIRIYYFNSKDRLGCFTKKITKLVTIKDIPEQVSQGNKTRISEDYLEFFESREDERKRAECYRKVVFYSERDASVCARKQTLKGRPRRHYQCTVCGQWHLTSQI